MAPRPRPTRTAQEISSTIGDADTGSKGKAKAAHERTEQHQPAPEAWPLNPQGVPMHKVTMTVSELIPTGQYANVSIGPAQVTAFVDPQREVEDGAYFSEQESATIAAALNQLAEIVEVDVLAVQRNIVLEAIQSQVSG